MIGLRQDRSHTLVYPVEELFGEDIPPTWVGIESSM